MKLIPRRKILFKKSFTYKFKYHSKTLVFPRNYSFFQTDVLIKIVHFIGRDILCAYHTFLQQTLTLKKVKLNERSKL